MDTQLTPPEARVIETCLARSAVYRALAVLLRHPDAQTAAHLAAREHHQLPAVIERLSGQGAGPLTALARRVVTLVETTAPPEWTRQHEGLFGHTVQSFSPPYELEYGEEHSHRQPQELGDIAAFYQAFGLRVAACAHERADHIVTECEFMQYLLYKQACALDEELTEQAQVCEEASRRFVADHLGRWGPAFALRLSRAAGEGLLAVAGEWLLAWLMQECTRMQVPVGSYDLPLRSPKEADVGCAACLPAQMVEGQAGALGRSDGPTTC